MRDPQLSTHPCPGPSLLSLLNPLPALQDELVQLLRSDGRRQAAQRMMKQKRDGQAVQYRGSSGGGGGGGRGNSPADVDGSE